jgi:hypothetical protein
METVRRKRETENENDCETQAKLFFSPFVVTATYGAFDIILSDATLHNREYVFAIYILPLPPAREKREK